MQDVSSDSFHVGVTGGDLFVRRWMPADSSTQSPVVLLHDSLGCVALWRDFPAQLALALKRPVLAYDRLGFGQSSARQAPQLPSFIDDEAQIVFPQLCKALNLAEVVLFGHSVGGAMAIAIAARQAQSGRCVCVITESAQGFIEPRTLEGILAAKHSFSDPRQFSRLAKYHGEKARWVLDAWTETWLDPGFRNWRLDPNLSQVTCPVLAIHGDQDEFGTCAFPRHIAGSVKSYSEAVILEGIGHVPHREDSKKVLEIVGSFLAKIEQDGTAKYKF